jgi:hypothetical protein
MTYLVASLSSVVLLFSHAPSNGRTLSRALFASSLHASDYHWCDKLWEFVFLAPNLSASAINFRASFSRPFLFLPQSSPLREILLLPAELVLFEWVIVIVLLQQTSSYCISKASSSPVPFLSDHAWIVRFASCRILFFFSPSMLPVVMQFAPGMPSNRNVKCTGHFSAKRIYGVNVTRWRATHGERVIQHIHRVILQK